MQDVAHLLWRAYMLERATLSYTCVCASTMFLVVVNDHTTCSEREVRGYNVDSTSQNPTALRGLSPVASVRTVNPILQTSAWQYIWGPIIDKKSWNKGQESKRSRRTLENKMSAYRVIVVVALQSFWAHIYLRYENTSCIHLLSTQFVTAF